MPKRTDANQPEIVKRYRQHGCEVSSIHTVGGGVPDLLVGVAGVTDVVEVKDGNKPPSRRKLTKDEKDWHDNWPGSVRIVETLDDVDDHVQHLRHLSRTIRAAERYPFDHVS